jgi:hypothetical protein
MEHDADALPTLSEWRELHADELAAMAAREMAEAELLVAAKKERNRCMKSEQNKRYRAKKKARMMSAGGEHDRRPPAVVRPPPPSMQNIDGVLPTLSRYVVELERKRLEDAEKQRAQAEWRELHAEELAATAAREMAEAELLVAAKKEKKRRMKSEENKRYQAKKKAQSEGGDQNTHA